MAKKSETEKYSYNLAFTKHCGPFVMSCELLNRVGHDLYTLYFQIIIDYFLHNCTFSANLEMYFFRKNRTRLM